MTKSDVSGSGAAHAAGEARTCRRVGSLLGLAIGDALGAAVEFKSPGSFKPVTDYRDGGPHGLAPGEWTDDTSMALALADSLASVGWDLEDQARRYLAWWKNGEYSVNGRCFDIGNATRSALARIDRGAAAHSGGEEADRASGNGSIMRLAPVPLRYLDLFPGELSKLATLAEESSYPTHRSPKCLSACRYLAVVLAALMDGREREEVLSADWSVLAELHAISPLHPAVLEVAHGSFRRKQPLEIKGSGYVVESLEAALWAFHQASSFRDAVLAAVNLGDDADTTGAVCGQLAGAYFGTDGMPPEWLARLAKRDWIEQASAKLISSHLARPSGFAIPDPGAERPFDRSYWVVRNRLLAGAYPGHQEPEQHAAQLKSLWDCGIRSVVNLMQKEERDHDGQPFSDYERALSEFATCADEVRFARFEIVDVRIPPEDMMKSILDYIDAELAAGRPVYIHCFGGIGRTGTVVACWLVRHGHASADDVLELLQTLRRPDAAADRESPETRAQRRFVRSWQRTR